MENEKIRDILFFIFGFIFILMMMGLFSYIGFKILRGTMFIYKDPNKEKNLNNIDFGQSYPAHYGHSKSPILNIILSYDKSIRYGEELPLRKNYFLRKFSQLTLLIILVTIIMVFLPIFYKSINKNPIYNKINYILIFFHLLWVYY
ncbi:hypothetical protein [Candidatus Phytoplasma pyri]|uniref:hypothetical protein n=1 Tax=Candidatus Phytoplasma pyri TaxID=47566 RepID=UPI0039839CD0